MAARNHVQMISMKHAVIVFALGLSALNAPLGLVVAQKPDVIVILSDDLGSVDAGCYGATDLVTPAVDSLAAHGVRFTQFYSAAPVFVFPRRAVDWKTRAATLASG